MNETIVAIVGTLGFASGAIAIRYIVTAVNSRKMPPLKLWHAGLLLPVLYIGFLGPTILVAHKVPAVRPVAQAIYSPLEWFAKNVPGPISEALNWYARLWQ